MIPDIVWLNQFGTSSADQAAGVAVDEAGNAHVTGGVRSALSGQTSYGGDDAYIVKFAEDATPPITTTSQNPPANANGWNNSDVTVSLTATDNPDGSEVKEIHYSINDGPETVVPGASASILLSTEGIYTIAY